jgi:hypothetical protein
MSAAAAPSRHSLDWLTTGSPKPRRRLRRTPLLLLDQIKLDSLRIDQLREVLRRNQVTFPSQVPTFERHDRPDLQWKIAQLYFVLGWSCEGIAQRYGLIHQRVRQILKTWKRRAVEMGFIQHIPLAAELAVVIQRADFIDQPAQPNAPDLLFPLPPPPAPQFPANLQGA